MTSVFSLKRNVRRAINLDDRKNNLSCLDGLRIIMSFRIAMGHAYMSTVITTRDPDKMLLLDHMTSNVNMIIDAFPLMNIFIMITGERSLFESDKHNYNCLFSKGLLLYRQTKTKNFSYIEFVVKK